MFGRLCTALTTALISGLSGAATIAPADPVAPPPAQSWAADLTKGNTNNVSFQGAALRLTARSGLLTMPAQHLTSPVARIVPTLSAAIPPGTVVEIDVRGLLPDGLWSEWLPTTAKKPATLPGPSALIQVRVLLAGTNTGSPARPDVTGLRLTAQPVQNMRIDAPPAEPASYQVIATREGLVNGRTANGHQIRSHDLFVALPSHRALADTDGSEYSVKVCSRLGYCAWVPVWDVGPWNTTDDYWSSDREQFGDLPQGVPEAQAAYRDGANGGKDGTGRKVTNPAGVDLSDGVYNDVLGLSGNAQVDLSYLWTGNTPLSRVDASQNLASQQSSGRQSSGQQLSGQQTSGQQLSGQQTSGQQTSGYNPARAASLRASDSSDGSSGDTSSSEMSSGVSKDSKYLVVVRTSADANSQPAGVAADHAGVPVKCVTSNGWLQIDPDAYLPASAVILSTQPGPC